MGGGGLSKPLEHLKKKISITFHFDNNSKEKIFFDKIYSFKW